MTTATAVRVDRSFDEFVVARSTRLLRSAFALCGDRHDAQDLLQVALVRVARHWERARQAPDAYAYRVLVNLARDRHRRASRRLTTVPLGDRGAGASADHADAVGERDAIARALAALPARQREAVTLRFLADLSVTQTAAAMRTSPGAVKTHTSRALHRLRDVLADPSETDRAH